MLIVPVAVRTELQVWKNITLINLISMSICYHDKSFEYLSTWDKYAGCSLVLQYSWHVFYNLGYYCFLESMCILEYKDMSNCFNEHFTSAPLYSHFIVNAIRFAMAFSL